MYGFPGAFSYSVPGLHNEPDDCVSLLKQAQANKFWPKAAQAERDKLLSSWLWKKTVCGLEPGIYLRLLADCAPLSNKELTDRAWYPFQSDAKHKLPLADRLVVFLATYSFNNSHLPVLKNLHASLERIRSSVVQGEKWHYDQTAVDAIDEQVLAITERLSATADQPLFGLRQPTSRYTAQNLRADTQQFIDADPEQRRGLGKQIFSKLSALTPAQYLALLADLSCAESTVLLHLAQLPLSPDNAVSWTTKLQNHLAVDTPSLQLRHQALHAQQLFTQAPWPQADSSCQEHLQAVLLSCGCDSIAQQPYGDLANLDADDFVLAARITLHARVDRARLDQFTEWIQASHDHLIPHLCALASLPPCSYVDGALCQIVNASACLRLSQLCRYSEHSLLYTMRCCVESQNHRVARKVLSLFLTPAWERRCASLTDTGKADVCDVGDYSPSGLYDGVLKLSH